MGLHADNITDLILYDTFVEIGPDGRALSRYENQNVYWQIVTGIEEVDAFHMYTKVCYAMLEAVYNKEDKQELDILKVRMSVQPETGNVFLIETACSDTSHAIVGKLKMIYERMAKHANTENNNA